MVLTELFCELYQYPALGCEDGLLDGVDELVDGRRWHAHALRAVLHPPRVLLRPEQRVPGAILPAVRYAFMPSKIPCMVRNGMKRETLPASVADD
jgi:hypothetical protein